eukprot:TRINITY_DN5058_c0_g1_i1.p2 TRINITY_DN5058_c0_g1~~TRINITY_DN5058_c0_g1_i1.p2  ORF type:complete len:103 (+),score=10.16 TRINITY_DN5058_c0_g1_i1:79-387(+)
MVTSTSTPGSMEMEVMCLTTSEGLWRSMRRLWMRISKRSQVLVPSPQGDLRVVITRFWWGASTGPFDLQLLLLGAVDQLGAHLLEVLHVPAGQGDADAVEVG